jgi:hypothetical protein
MQEEVSMFTTMGTQFPRGIKDKRGKLARKKELELADVVGRAQGLCYEFHL